MSKKPTSVRLSEEHERLLALLIKRTSVGRSAVIGMAIEHFANFYLSKPKGKAKK